MKINESMAIIFWLNRSKKDGNGRVPVYCRITINLKRTEFSIGRKADPDKWHNKGGYQKGRDEEAVSLNKEIAKLKASIQKHHDILSATKEYVTGEMIKNALFGIATERKTICDIFKYHNEKFKEKVDKEKRSALTYRRYVRTLEKVMSFMRYEFKCSDVPLCELKESFAAQFEHFLTIRQGISNNTAMKYVSTLKQVVNKAISLGWVLYNPLSGFKCPYEQPERAVLTMAEIVSMYQKKMPLRRLEEARDIYVFCCFTGLAFNEVYRLAPENVEIGNDGKKWIIIERKKTGNPEHVPLLKIAEQIIEKYRKHPHCVLNDKLLPVICNQRYNGYIKEIATICEISKDLTSHTARHTFATTVTLENDVPIESVSKMLGHTSIKTTQIYAKITKMKLSNNMSVLEAKLPQIGR